MSESVQKDISNILQPEANWFKTKVRKVLPKWLKRISYIVFLCVTSSFSLLMAIGMAAGVVTINLGSLTNILNTGTIIQQIGDNNIAVLGETKCTVSFCSSFLDGLWLGLDKFTEVQRNPLVLKSPISRKQPGATAYYKEQIGDFTSKIFITPQATVSASLVLTYGSLYRCILGDGDYKAIACQVNEDYPRVPENWVYFDREGNLRGRQYQIRPFEPNEELEIRFEQRTESGKKIISLKINEQVPADWILPSKYHKTAKLEHIGIGLITTRYDDAQAIFKRFELDADL